MRQPTDKTVCAIVLIWSISSRACVLFPRIKHWIYNFRWNFGTKHAPNVIKMNMIDEICVDRCFEMVNGEIMCIIFGRWGRKKTKRFKYELPLFSSCIISTHNISLNGEKLHLYIFDTHDWRTSDSTSTKTNPLKYIRNVRVYLMIELLKTKWSAHQTHTKIF